VNNTPTEDRVVRDDDLVFGIPGFTRYKLRWLVTFLAAVCIAAIAFVGYTIIHNSHQEKNDIHDLACAIVAPSPPGIDYVDHFRAKYNCPPFDPKLRHKIVIQIKKYEQQHPDQFPHEQQPQQQGGG
jgi:hypothetical protein